MIQGEAALDSSVITLPSAPVIVQVPATFWVEPVVKRRVRPVELLVVEADKLKKVLLPEMSWVLPSAPLKVMVPAVGVKVPVFVKSPVKVALLVPVAIEPEIFK